MAADIAHSAWQPAELISQSPNNTSVIEFTSRLRGGTAMASAPAESSVEQQLSDPKDVGDLHQYGYTQSLRRTMGPFASFSVAFSMVSITTAIFFLLPSLFGTSGAVGVWLWLPCAAGVFLIVMVYSHLDASDSRRHRAARHGRDGRRGRDQHRQHPAGERGEQRRGVLRDRRLGGGRAAAAGRVGILPSPGGLPHPHLH